MRKNAIVTKEKYVELNEAISERLNFNEKEDTKQYAPDKPIRELEDGRVILPITSLVFEKCADLIKDLEYEEDN